MRAAVLFRILRVIHIYSAIVLVGAIVFNTGVLMPALRRIPPAHAAVVSQKIGAGLMWLATCACSCGLLPCATCTFWVDDFGHEGKVTHSIVPQTTSIATDDLAVFPTILKVADTSNPVPTVSAAEAEARDPELSKMQHNAERAIKDNPWIRKLRHVEDVETR